ncbi:hypothetical protein BM221_005296 [Beauveria bassiana]|uniref:Uncharacterized protein n=1 Tax=Beauveria bassiana TaxID=176275 RepID=A0A2N6NN72_BEABA|nr:hypothetical protein BM221_005296 [Beauveria bassiana]
MCCQFQYLFSKPKITTTAGEVEKDMPSGFALLKMNGKVHIADLSVIKGHFSRRLIDTAAKLDIALQSMHSEDCKQPKWRDALLADLVWVDQGQQHLGKVELVSGNRSQEHRLLMPTPVIQVNPQLGEEKMHGFNVVGLHSVAEHGNAHPAGRVDFGASLQQYSDERSIASFSRPGDGCDEIVLFYYLFVLELEYIEGAIDMGAGRERLWYDAVGIASGAWEKRRVAQGFWAVFRGFHVISVYVVLDHLERATIRARKSTYAARAAEERCDGDEQLWWQINQAHICQ